MDSKTPSQALVQAAESLVGTDIFEDWEHLSIQQGTAYLDDNRDALQAARNALDADCLVPLRYEAPFFEEDVKAIGHLRNLSRSFQLDVKRAVADHNFTTAVRLGVKILELASAMRRGGLIIDLLVSFAIAEFGINELRQLRDRLSLEDGTALGRDLVRIEGCLEAVAAITQRDRQWETAVNWQDPPLDIEQNLDDPLEPGLDESEIVLWHVLRDWVEQPDDEKLTLYQDLDHRLIAGMRMLSVDLALRSFRALTQTYPDQLEQLAPAFLSKIPNDPFTGEPFRYHRTAANAFTLYSVGPLRVDHGGVFGSWPMVLAGMADLGLDVYDHSPD